MRRILDGVGFSERAHFDCVEQAFEVTLRYLGHELEDILFDDWRFIYVRPAGPPGCFLGPGPPLDRLAKFRAYGAELIFHRRDEPEAALVQIQSLVVRGAPVPVWVDPYYLAHYSRQNPRHTVHAVVVAGFDDTAGSVHIIDPSPWQLFRGDIAVTALMQALASAHLEERERNSWVEFERLGGRQADNAEAVGRKLAANRQAMLGDGHGRRVEMDGRGGLLLEGVRGIRQLACDMRTWVDLEGEVLQTLQRGAREPLQVVGRHRYGHARYLANAGDRLGVESISDVALELEELAEAWFLPGNLLFKGSLREPAAMLERAALRVEALAAREEELLMCLSPSAEGMHEGHRDPKP